MLNIPNAIIRSGQPWRFFASSSNWTGILSLDAVECFLTIAIKHQPLDMNLPSCGGDPQPSCQKTHLVWSNSSHHECICLRPLPISLYLKLSIRSNILTACSIAITLTWSPPVILENTVPWGPQISWHWSNRPFSLNPSSRHFYKAHERLSSLSGWAFFKLLWGWFRRIDHQVGVRKWGVDKHVGLDAVTG